MANQEVKIKFSADASQYNSAIRSMVTQNSELSKMFDHMNRHSAGGLNTGDFRGTLSGKRNIGNFGSFQSPAMFAGIGGVATAGLAVAAAAIAYGKAVSAYAGHLQDASDKTDVSAESLQRWGEAASDVGADLDSVTQAFKRMRKAQADALGGDVKKQDAFAALGVDVTQSPEKVFEAIAKTFRDGSNSAKEYGAAMDILGKNADELMATFKSDLFSGKGLYIASSENVKALDDMGDAMKRLWTNMKSFGIDAFGEILNIRKNNPGGSASANTLATLQGEEAAAKKAENDKAKEDAKAQLAKEEADAEQAKEAEKAAAEKEKRIQDLQAEFDKKSTENNWNKLTPEQQRSQLKRQLANVESTLSNGGLDDEQSLRLRVTRENLISKIGNAPEGGIGQSRLEGDSMRRIGLYVGQNGSNPVLTKLDKLIQGNTEIRRAIREAL